MARLGSIDEFEQWRRKLQAELDEDRKIITICEGTGCRAFGAVNVQEAFEEELKRQGLTDQISVKSTGCHGFCEKGPLVVIMPRKIFYPNVKTEDVAGHAAFVYHVRADPVPLVSRMISGTHDWTEITLDVPASYGPGHPMRAQAYFWVEGPGVAWFDNLERRRVP